MFAVLYGRLAPLNLLCYLYGSNQTIIQTPGHLWFLPAFLVSVLLFNSLQIKNKWWLDCCFFAVMLCLAYFTSYGFNLCIPINSWTLSLTGIGSIGEGRHLNVGFPFGLNISFMGVALMYYGKFLQKAVR